jgi:GNAT superfamily N-acetyltransferase
MKGPLTFPLMITPESEMMQSDSKTPFLIRRARKEDVPLILDFIKKLAEYERLSHEVVATVADLEQHLFGDRIVAEVLLGYEGEEPVGFALFFHNFSTFLGKPGIYLEDLFVLEEHRGKGYGTRLLASLAALALERDCGRLEWAVLDWNEPSIDFYKSLGAKMMNEWIVNRMTGESLSKLAERY